MITSSVIPSAKYSFSASGLILVNGSTASEMVPAAAGASRSGAALGLSRVAGEAPDLSCVHANSAIATTSSAMMARSSRRVAVAAAAGSPAAPASRRRPSGVSSYTHESTSTATNPIASSATTTFDTHVGASKIGNNVFTTCTTSHAPIRYKPAMRMTLRRWSSASRLMPRRLPARGSPSPAPAARPTMASPSPDNRAV